MAATNQASNKQTRMSRQAGKPAATDSTLASLETKTTPAAVRAARPAALATGNNFTGQYLYDTFIGDGDKFEASKMDVVRQMVTHLDTASFKKVVGEFVGVAKSFYDRAVNEAKQGGLFDAKNPTPAMDQTAARLKTAKNHQTVMRIAYGALKFAPEYLTEQAGDPATIGYQLMRVVGMKALASKGINWDGSKAEPAEARQARQQQDAETKVMLEVQRELPKQANEDRAKYLDRVLKETDKRMKAKKEQDHADAVNKLAAKIRADAGPLLDEVLDALMQPAPEADPALH